MALGLLRFTNGLGGTADFIYPGPATDMQSPASAGAVNGTTYLYYAQSLDMTEWEIGKGAYASAGGTFARTTITANSLGTTAKISFTNPPQVVVFDTFPATDLSAYSTTAQMNAAIAAATREKLTSARNYYVRTDGSDANNGLANTAGGAFRTIQKAVDVVASLDMSIYQVTIQVGAGTYTAGVALRQYLGTIPPIINGDTVTPTNVVVSVTGATCFTNDGNAQWTIRGFRLKTTTSGNCFDASNGGRIYFNAIDFNGASAGFAHMRAVNLGIVYALGTYTISGSAEFHIVAGIGGMASVVNAGTVVVSGTPAFGSVFAYAIQGGNIYSSGATFSGAATGARYASQFNGVIYTGGGGATYFPGSIAGATATGGQYA